MLSEESRNTTEDSTHAPPALHGAAGLAKAWGNSLLATVRKELQAHAPFTMLGTLTGIAIMVALIVARVPRSWSAGLFWGLHPLHVLLSALVTAGMFRLHSRARLWATIAVGYVGSVGIATLSDCIIPYVGESLLGLANKGVHLGFIEKWWLVNPLALAGIAVACLWPKTRFPHAGHVLLSTWASLFHMTMALGDGVGLSTLVIIPIFLFLAVWIPCCTSDIVFPLLFANGHVRSDEASDTSETDTSETSESGSSVLGEMRDADCRSKR